jgi:carbon-monoxide dehydrogenase medium subunit
MPLRPRPFEYYAPTTLTEALSLLSSKEEAKILAGGQSLLSLMKLRLAAPKTLIDINGLTGLSHIAEEDGSIVIGSMVRHDQLTQSATIRTNLPLLADAASLIADQQVRNRGTIGGSLVHADPGADLSTACKALRAKLTAVGPRGSRSITVEDLFRDYFTTSLEAGEIATEIRIPLPPPRSGGSYLKLTKGHNDFAIVAVAAQLTFDSEFVCRNASVVLGGVARTPVHAAETERVLTSRKLDHILVEEAAQGAAEGLNPNADFRASAEYRLKMTKTLTSKAIELASSRAKGSS